MIRNPLDRQNDDIETDHSDLEMARPSYDATSYARSGSVFRTSLIMIGIGVFSSLAAGLYYYAYQRGLEDGQREMPPVIAANPDPIRVSPEVAGVATKMPEDENIYDVMQGKAEAVAPAENDGQPESLLLGAKDPAAQKPEKGAPKDAPKKAEAVAKAPEVSRPDKGEAKTPPPANVKTASPTPIVERPKAASPTKAKTDNVKAKPAPAIARFMVQVASTRSRAAARKAYADQSKKYPDLLARREPLILPVDLGSKGIYYRVNVSGFSTKEKATQFCADLKKAGGSCLVKKEPA